MGKHFFDQYSLLHFTSGILCRHLNFSFTFLLIFHILFEYVENTNKGMYFINNYFKIWPGGKNSSDTFENSVGDIIFSLIGWVCMDYLTKNNMKKFGVEFYLGVLIYFWLYPKYRLVICLLIIFLIYSVYKYNLLYGFLLSLLLSLFLDRIGLYYK